MSKISNRLAFFAKIKQRSAELTKTAEEWAAIWAKEGKAEAGAINVHEDHKPFKEREPYTTDRYATDINYAVSQFPDKSAAIVNNDVTARAKKVSEGHFTGASHYLVNEVMIENAGARGYALMVTGWTGKGTLTKTVNGVVNEGPYAPGTQVVATFTPAAGYSFTSWGDGNTSNPRTFTMNSNIVTTIVTDAIPKYTLAFSATGDGSISATVGGQSVTTGTEVYVGSTVVLTATPNEGKTVDQWSGLPEGTVPVGNVATFTMPSAAVTASVSFKVATQVLHFVPLTGSAKIGVIVSPYLEDEETVSTPSMKYSLTGDAEKASDWTEVSFASIKYIDVEEEPGSGKLGRFNYAGPVADGYRWGLVDYPSVYAISASDSPAQGDTVPVYGFLPQPITVSISAVSTTESGLIEIPANGLYFKSDVDWKDSELSTYPCKFTFTNVSSDFTYGVSGKISYLFNGTDTVTSLIADKTNNWFQQFFWGDPYIVNAGGLELTSVVHSGFYYAMFAGCSALTTPPSTLPATTLALSCYESMFENCVALDSSSSLLATTLAQDCYKNMFKNTNVLPDCSKIDFNSSAVVASRGLAGLFAGTKVTSTDLVNILPKVGDVPTLPVTLVDGTHSYCYEGMFAGCTSLTSAPSLPSTTLATACYSEMFAGCTALTASPVLSAATLVIGCYDGMFYGCSSLATVTCYATSISASGYTTTENWLEDVAASGDFYWSTEEEPTTSPGWSRDASGIPSSWTPHPDIPAPAWNGLTFTSSGTVKMYLYEGSFCENENGDLDFVESPTNYLNCQYSIDGGQNWVTMPTTSGSAVEIPSTEMWVRGNNPSGWSTLNSNTNSGRFIFSGSGSGSVTVSGSVMSLIDQTGTLTELPENSGFAALFYNGTIASISAIKDASGLILPATRLYQFSYWGMFSAQDCLIKAPSLPATILGSRCYEAMFRSCSSLAGPINISATSPYYSGTSACSNMFASSATSSGAGGTIYVGGNVSDWNSSTAGIDSTYWTVQLKTEDE